MSNNTTPKDLKCEPCQDSSGSSNGQDQDTSTLVPIKLVTPGPKPGSSSGRGDPGQGNSMSRWDVFDRPGGDSVRDSLSRSMESIDTAVRKCLKIDESRSPTPLNDESTKGGKEAQESHTHTVGEESEIDMSSVVGTSGKDGYAGAEIWASS